MKFLSRIKANFEIVAKAKFKSEELSLLYAMIETGDGTYDYYMSPESDEEWEYQQKENDETDREQWAKQEDEFKMDHGNAAHYFSFPQRKTNVWTVHFTDANPVDIAREGLKGRDTYGIGLTTMFTPEANPGNLAFGYPRDKIYEVKKYGTNALLIFVPEALICHHAGDEEYQTIFDVRHIKKIYPVQEDDGEFILYDGKSGEELGRCDQSKSCIEDLIKIVEGLG